MSEGLLERLAHGPVICAEGYLFECERRGYLQAGAFRAGGRPRASRGGRQLHRDFVRAGSDVVEAFTYYGHREKLQVIGKEGHPRAAQSPGARDRQEGRARVRHAAGRQPLQHERLEPDDDESRRSVRAIFDEQVAWAMDAGVDFLIGETFSSAGEALIALEAIKASGLPAVVTLVMHRDAVSRDGLPPGEACARLEAAGADVVGLNCSRGPQTMLPLLEPIRAAVSCPVAALPVPYRTHAGHPTLQSLPIPPAILPDAARSRWRSTRSPAPATRSPSSRKRLRASTCATSGLLRRRPAPHPRAGRGARAHPAREPLLARHVAALLPGRRGRPRRLPDRL